MIAVENLRYRTLAIKDLRIAPGITSVIGLNGSGKTTLLTSTKPVDQTLTAGIGELCETSLNENERGNGIHQWNCERNLISGNEISEARDGIYFSFTRGQVLATNSRPPSHCIKADSASSQPQKPPGWTVTSGSPKARISRPAFIRK